MLDVNVTTNFSLFHGSTYRAPVTVPCSADSAVGYRMQVHRLFCVRSSIVLVQTMKQYALNYVIMNMIMIIE